MSAYAYLVLVVVSSVVGSLVVLARNRSSRSVGDEVDEFAERMRALSAAPPDDRSHRGRR